MAVFSVDIIAGEIGSTERGKEHQKSVIRLEFRGFLGGSVAVFQSLQLAGLQLTLLPLGLLEVGCATHNLGKSAIETTDAKPLVWKEEIPSWGFDSGWGSCLTPRIVNQNPVIQ